MKLKLRPQLIMLKISIWHKVKTGKVIKVSKWGYDKDDFVNNKMSFIHQFIGAN